MTVFVLSHNLQLSSGEVPAIAASELAEGLLKESDHIQSSEALTHPHWLVKIESDLSAQELAQELIQAGKIPKNLRPFHDPCPSCAGR